MLANLGINKFVGKAFFSVKYAFILLAAMQLSACGGGGGGGGGGGFGLNSGPVSGSSGSASLPTLYKFDVVAGTPYTVAMANTSGDTAIYLYNVDPYSVTSPVPFGISWQSGNYEAVSFIASSTGTVYALAIAFDVSTTYTIEATSNNLTVNAAARTDSVYGNGIFGSNLFYSFDALIGTTYEVRVTPTQGNVDLTRVTLNTDMTGSIGSSLNAGTATDAVFFTATATGRYYIRVDGTNVDSTFGIRVLEVPAGPDLTVVIDGAVSDGANVILNYTVSNNGADAYTGDFQVDVWSDAATAPAVGSTGENFTTHTGTVSGLGGSVSGQLTVPNAAETGTAYVVVDTLEAVLESDESNNVSAGVSWEKPLLAPLAGFDFEAGVVPAKTVMSGDSNWAIDNTAAGTGSIAGSLVSLVSGAINDSQRSCFAFNAYNSQSASISFDRKVSSESWDKLRFYIDGVSQNTWSGTVAWGNVSFNITSGVHEYKWCYTKDFSVSSGTDQAWVDNIDIVSVPSNLSATITSVSSNGADVTINYRISNVSGVPVGPFAVDFWSDALVSPTVGATGETTAIHNAGLTAYSSVTGSVTIANAAISGTAYVVVDTTNAILETNEANNISAGMFWGTPELSVVVTNVVASGTNIFVTYSVSNTGAGDATAFSVEIWDDAAVVPVIGDVGASTVAITSLAAGASVSGTVSIANTVTTGTAYAIVDTGNVINETDENNNVSAGLALALPLAAYDFEVAPIPAEWVMSGTAGWILDGANGASGSTSSMVSGVITHSQISCAAVTVAASSNVSFDYSVSSESGYDFLRFYIDGVILNAWSGVMAWSNSSYAITSGAHEYKWCYEKDGSVSSGSDMAWIDNIIIN